MRSLSALCAALCLATQFALAQDARDPVAAKVRALVEDMLIEGKAQQAFSELERMDMEAVPYLVGHLDDLRPLPVRRISLVNKSSSAFEAVRHYGPETVHDALSALLNQISGQHFEFVYNGATDAERAANLESWRSWCARRFPEKTRVCNGAI